MIFKKFSNDFVDKYSSLVINTYDNYVSNRKLIFLKNIRVVKKGIIIKRYSIEYDIIEKPNDYVKSLNSFGIYEIGFIFYIDGEKVENKMREFGSKDLVTFSRENDCKKMVKWLNDINNVKYFMYKM